MGLFGGWIEKAIADPESEEEIAERLNVRLCNCAECGRQLVGVADYQKFFVACIRAFAIKPQALRAVAGKIKDRPYCFDCLSNKKS